MTDNLLGTSISYYKIISLLGEGGMGSVYLAEDTMLERKVAIKILNPLLTKDPLFVQRFRHEAKVQSSLHYLNIVILYAFFEEQGNYCMVMEYAEGETLKELIRRTGPLPEQRVEMIFNQLMRGLEFAHKKGVIHRDIKPSNIMIDKDDNIKIMDFGIAKIMGDMNLTKTGMKIGTIYYMSPEQVRAEKNIDHKTDIYSAGITLYEMLTGKLPYETTTESDYEIMKEIVERQIKDPREFYPHISKHWVEVIQIMTNKDKKFRKDTLYDYSVNNEISASRFVPTNQKLTYNSFTCPSCNFIFPEGDFERCPNCNMGFNNTICVLDDNEPLKKNDRLQCFQYPSYICPACSHKMIVGKHRYCSECGADFGIIIEVLKKGNAILVEENDEEFYCDNCKTLVDFSAKYCRLCGEKLDDVCEGI